MDVSFLLGLVLAIPLSIAGNLATPRVQQFLARRSERRRILLSELSNEKREVVTWFANNPMIFTAYLVRTGFEMVGPVLVMIGAITVYALARPLAIEKRSAVDFVLMTLAAIVFISCLIYMFNVLGRVIGHWLAVQHEAAWPITTGFRIKRTLKDRIQE